MANMQEIWKPIKGFETHYMISNYGRVKSLDRVVYQLHKDGGQARHIYKGQIIKPSKMQRVYHGIELSKNGIKYRFLVHRLVAEHFIPKPEGKNYINHLDCNPLNNYVENLEWCTQSENIQYAYDIGRKIPPHQKKTAQYDFEGNLIKIWISQSEAGRSLNIPQANIYKVCRGLRRHAGGYVWKYTE